MTPHPPRDKNVARNDKRGEINVLFWNLPEQINFLLVGYIAIILMQMLP